MGAFISGLLFQPPELSKLPARFEDRSVRISTDLGSSIRAVHLDYGYEFTVLFSHGNAEDVHLLSSWFDKNMCRLLRVNVFLYDYSGYGDSTGKPSEKNLYADAEAAYLYLKQSKEISPQQIILYGRSLGSAATIHLASKFAQDNIRGVVLQSPLLSVFRIPFNFRFTLPGDPFPNIEKVSKIPAKVCIIHGTEDEVVPFWHGEKMFSLLQNPARPLFIKNGGHNNLETDFEELLFNRLEQFFNSL